MRYRIIALLTVTVVCFLSAFTAFAEDFAESVQTEALTETEAPAPETLSDELPEGIESADKDELIDIINGLSGEGVHKVQEILLAGINSIEEGQSTTWDNVAYFVERHIEAVSLIVCALAVIAYMTVRTKANKRLRKDITVATNNAVETVEIAKQMNADSVSALEDCSRSVKDFEKSLNGAVDKIDALLEENREKSAECESLRNALKHNSAADMLVADTVNELLQLANISQTKKDAIYEKVLRAKALINREESADNEGRDEKKANSSVV